MKKMMSLLSLSTLTLAAVFSAGAGCGSGSEIQACDEAAPDCGAGQICVDSQCVLDDEPVCAVDVDCDLANSQSPSTATDCDSGDESPCDVAGGEVCVADGVGETYCVLADSDDVDQGCEEIDPNFKAVDADGKRVCVVDANVSCDADGQCS